MEKEFKTLELKSLHGMSFKIMVNENKEKILFTTNPEHRFSMKFDMNEVKKLIEFLESI